MVKLTLPYISGFLAFREAPHLLAELNTLKQSAPEFYPQVCCAVLSHPMASS
jgi:hypothetical protein